MPYLNILLFYQVLLKKIYFQKFLENNNLKQDNRCKLFFHTIYNNEYNEKRKEIEELNVLLKKIEFT